MESFTERNGLRNQNFVAFTYVVKKKKIIQPDVVVLEDSFGSVPVRNYEKHFVATHFEVIDSSFKQR